MDMTGYARLLAAIGFLGVGVAFWKRNKFMSLVFAVIGILWVIVAFYF